MVEELIPTAVDPVAAGRDFWTRYHELRGLQHSELRPDDPLTPDDVVEAQMKKPNPFDLHHYFEISRDGVMLSWFNGETVAPANPEYVTNKHLYWANGYVRPDHRRRGIGTKWLKVIAELMDDHGCTLVGFHTTQDTGHAFIQRLGAEPKLTEIESRLKPPDVNWAPYRRTLIEQQFTGVLPAARGRGIGKWIKAAMLLHVRELYPDAEWVVTGNAHSNAPMLKINRTMGFKAYRTGVEYQMTRDELGARI